MAKRQKNRQCNGQKTEDKRINNDLQNTTQQTEDRATRVNIYPAPHVVPLVLLLLQAQ
jgi:hypothetical protein